MHLASITERAVVFITTAWGGVYVCRLHTLAYSMSVRLTHLSSFSPHLQRHLLRIPVGVWGKGKECVAVSEASRSEVTVLGRLAWGSFPDTGHKGSQRQQLATSLSWDYLTWA